MKNANQSKCFALLNDLGFICRRQNKKIIKIPHIKPVDAASIEAYFHQHLICFMPWRDKNLLKTKLQSYQEAFLYATENNK